MNFKNEDDKSISRTERDLNIKYVLYGAFGLIFGIVRITRNTGR